MKERIQQLAQGKIQVELPDLAFFPESLNREVPVGVVISLEVLVKSRNKVPFKGFFYSSDERVKVLTPAMAGQTGSITLEISTRNCSVHDVIEGELQMVSNAGERCLPYRLTVSGGDSFENWPKTIEAFVDLVKSDRRRALRMFTSAQFIRLPFLAEPETAAVYDGIRAGGSDEQALEAFLAACGAKQPVQFSIAQTSAALELAAGQSGRGEIPVHINTWGRVKICIYSDMPWLTVEKSVMTEKDFTDGESVIRFRVDAGQMHGGKNVGELLIKSDTQSVTFFIHADLEAAPRQKGIISRDTVSGLYRLMLDFINGTYEESVTLQNMDRTLAGCMKKYPGEISLYLYRAWVLLEEGQTKEAKTLLDWCRETIARKRSEIPVIYCIFLYLDSKARKDETVRETAKKIIHKYFEAVPNRWIALAELIAVREASDEEAIAFLEETDRAYGSSPMIYALASVVFRRRPEMMDGSPEFRFRVFRYMVRYQCCPDSLLDSFLPKFAESGLSGQVQLSVLCRLYEDKKSDRVLEAVCSLLVRMGRTGARWSKWYEEAIRRQIQLTGLNDCYLASIPMDENSRLPLDILLYYSYKNDLDDRTRLCLYTYVLEHYTRESEMYRAYENQINEFAISCLLAGRISPDLVKLYRTVLSPGLVDRRLGKVLPDLLFSRQIATSLPYACRVVVRYPQIRRESVIQLEQGQACVPVYTENAAILFEDANGSRFSDPGHREEQLMHQADLISACRRQSPNQLMLMLEETSQLYRQPVSDDRMYRQVRTLLDGQELTASFRQLLICRAVEYCCACSAHADKKGEAARAGSDEESTAWLLGLDLQQLPAQIRAKTAELYIQRGRMKEALAVVRQYGVSGIKVSLLLKMTVRCITELLYEEDEYLVRLGLWLLQKKQWNEVLISYLAQYYNGLTDRMLQLLLLTQETQTDPADLPERVTAQMMFTGNWSRIDEAYAIYNRDGQAKEPIRSAYHVLKCHAYLTGQSRTLPKETAEMAEEMLLSQKPAPQGFRFALLLQYAQLPQLNDKQKYLCEHLLYGLCADDCYLECYPALSRHIEMPHQMEGRVIIQKNAVPGRQMLAEGTQLPQNTQVSQEMREVYPGIYIAVFFLFPGETLQLTITGEAENGEKTEESEYVTAAGCYARKDSLYDQISRLIELKNSNELEEMKRKSAQMQRQKRVVRDLFTLM